MSISFVGSATWSNTAASTTITFTRPSGVQAGDLMIAYAGIAGDVNPAPSLSGWTALTWQVGGVGNNPTTSMSWYRFAADGDPSSWVSGTLANGPEEVRVTTVSAYRGVNRDNPFYDYDSSPPGGGNNTITADAITLEDHGPTVVSMWAGRASSSGGTFTHGQAGYAERSDQNAGASSDWMTVAVYDTGGPVDILGDITVSATLSTTLQSGGTWSAALNPGEMLVPCEPKFRDSASSSGTGATLVAAMPTHRAGDLLLWATVCGKASTSVDPSVNNGWVQLRQSANTNFAGSLWAKVATSSSESAPTLTVGGSGSSKIGSISHMLSYRYAEGLPTAHAASAGTTGTDHATPDVSSSFADATVFRVVMSRDSQNVAANYVWSSSTERLESTQAGGGGGFFDTDELSQSCASLLQASAGAAGSETVTAESSTEVWVAISAVLESMFRTGADVSGAATDSGVKQIAGPAAAFDSGSAATDSGRVRSAVADAGSTAVDVAGTVRVSGAADSGLFSESASVRVGSVADSSTVADSGRVLSALVPVTDAGSVVDSSTPPSNTAAVVDAVDVVDSASVCAISADVGAVSEFALPAGADAGSAASSASVRSAAVDSGVGSDDAFASNTALSGDVGVASDSASVRMVSADAGLGVEFAVPHAFEAGSVAGVANVAAAVTDSGSAADDAFASNTSQDSDQFAMLESPALLAVVVVELVGATDAAGLRADVAGSDGAAGAESTVVRQGVSDAAGAVDVALVVFAVADVAGSLDVSPGIRNVVSDTASVGDTASVIVWASGDSGYGLDAGSPLLPVADRSGLGVDAAVLQTYVVAADAGSVVESSCVGLYSGDIYSGVHENARRTIPGELADRSIVVLPESRLYGVPVETRATLVAVEARWVIVSADSRTRTVGVEWRLVVVGADPTVHL